MSEHTAIPWCDHTFNPWWGCENISPGCAHCYAERHAKRFGGKGLWGPGHSFKFASEATWKSPLKWNRDAETEGVRRRVFCASMADVFEEREELDDETMKHYRGGYPTSPRAAVLDLVVDTPNLDWLFLTKRPEFMRDWLARWYGADAPLPNLWLGVTIENARYTYRADILREIPAAVRFISAEPLLGSLFSDRFACSDCGIVAGKNDPPRLCSEPRSGSQYGHMWKPLTLDLTGIDWVIAGAESGPKARPMDEEWVRELRDACLGATTSNPGCCSANGRPAFFYKQQIVNGRKVECPELDGRQWMEFPR